MTDSISESFVSRSPGPSMTASLPLSSTHEAASRNRDLSSTSSELGDISAGETREQDEKDTESFQLARHLGYFPLDTGTMTGRGRTALAGTELLKPPVLPLRLRSVVFESFVTTRAGLFIETSG
jgi:hypothetical protein